MFIVIKNNGDNIDIRDTSDNTDSSVSRRQLHLLVSNLGIHVKGCRINKRTGDIVIKCKEGMSLAESYINETSQAFARMKLMGNTSGGDREALYQLAKEYGVVNNDEEFSVDLDKSIVAFGGEFNMIVTYDGINKGDTKREVDIRDKDVSRLFHLGEACFGMIYLYVDTQDKTVKVTLKDIIDELRKISDDIDDIQYIGITPSNNMFKIIAYDSCYSLKVDLMSKILKNKDKILGTKVTKLYGFVPYIKSLNENSGLWGISKVSLKTGKAYLDNRTLHSKYPTLHDVYVDKAFY